MTISLPAHKTDDSNQLTETTLSERVRANIAQLEDLVARRRKIRADVIKLLREIYQTNSDQQLLFGSYKEKAHRYFAKDPWIKDRHLGADRILLKLLIEVHKNYSCSEEGR